MSIFSKKDEQHPENVNPKQPETTGGEQQPAPETDEGAPEQEPTAPETEKPEAAQPAPSKEAEELAAVKDRYTRLMADFDNFRKRQVRERDEFVKRANERLLEELLPIVDNMELALSKCDAEKDPMAAGVKMVHDQLVALLKKFGMEPIDAAGQPFDPNLHEALSQIPSPTVPAMTVIEQYRRGWKLAGRVLRPAQVIVSAGAPEEPPAAASEAEAAPDEKPEA